jgi:hypothetical protein
MNGAAVLEHRWRARYPMNAVLGGPGLCPRRSRPAAPYKGGPFESGDRSTSLRGRGSRQPPLASSACRNGRLLLPGAVSPTAEVRILPRRPAAQATAKKGAGKPALLTTEPRHWAAPGIERGCDGL